MVNCPGVAAKVFSLTSEAAAEIRLITTSESQISILVTKSDFDAVYNKLSAELK